MKNLFKTLSGALAIVLASTMIVGTVLADQETVNNPAEEEMGEFAEEVAAQNSTTYSGTCGDNLTWTLDSDGLLTISGSGAMYDYSDVDVPWYLYRSYITTVSIQNGVTSIGAYAFIDCTSITSVEIPEGVTSIGSYSFGDCHMLTSITIPSSMISIDNEAFCYCSGLTSIEIPSSVTYFGYCPFADCSGLTSIVVDENNTVYDSRDNCNAIIETSANELIQGCMNTIIPSSVTSIGFGAFGVCTGLTGIEIPSGVTSIDSGAFLDCSGLTSIVVDKENTVYDSRDNCNAIIETSTNELITGCKNTVIPSSVTNIGWCAFWGCIGLTSIEIPSSVTYIGSYSFAHCSGLTSIVVDENNTVYDSRDNCNAIIETSANTLVLGCQNTVIPSNVTSLGSCAFYDRIGLTSIEIPSSVTYIGYNAFNSCSGLTSVVIPSSVTSIDDSAFDRCPNLVFYGSTGSYAETYAVNHNITFKTANTYTGFACVDGSWIYYENGEPSDYTGMIKGIISDVSTSAKWYYVKNGVFTKASGITQKVNSTDTKWYYVKNGVYTTATGIARRADGSSSTWYYVKNGVYTTATGIAKRADGSSSTWFYVKNGVFTKSSGIALKADGSSSTWFYVKNGVFTKATGIAKKADGSSSTWFYVKNGKYTAGVTTAARKADGSSKTLYYVRNSKFVKWTGTFTVGSKKYNVVNGVVK